MLWKRAYLFIRPSIWEPGRLVYWGFESWMKVLWGWGISIWRFRGRGLGGAPVLGSVIC
jgi:hypothetical protein